VAYLQAGAFHQVDVDCVGLDFRELPVEQVDDLDCVLLEVYASCFLDFPYRGVKRSLPGIHPPSDCSVVILERRLVFVGRAVLPPDERHPALHIGKEHHDGIAALDGFVRCGLRADDFYEVALEQDVGVAGAGDNVPDVLPVDFPLAEKRNVPVLDVHVGKYLFIVVKFALVSVLVDGLERDPRAEAVLENALRLVAGSARPQQEDMPLLGKFLQGFHCAGEEIAEIGVFLLLADSSVEINSDRHRYYLGSQVICTRPPFFVSIKTLLLFRYPRICFICAA